MREAQTNTLRILSSKAALPNPQPTASFRRGVNPGCFLSSVVSGCHSAVPTLAGYEAHVPKSSQIALFNAMVLGGGVGEGVGPPIPLKGLSSLRSRELNCEKEPQNTWRKCVAVCGRSQLSGC